MVGGGLKGSLQCAEQTSSAGNSNSHGAQFAKDLVPRFEGDSSAGGWDTGQEFMETGQTMRGQGDGEGNTIDEPTQENLDGGPGAVTFEEFFDGGRFLPVPVRLGQGAKDSINGVQENTFCPPAPLAIALNQFEVVVNINISVGNRVAGRRTVAGGWLRGQEAALETYAGKNRSSARGQGYGLSPGLGAWLWRRDWSFGDRVEAMGRGDPGRL